MWGISLALVAVEGGLVFAIMIPFSHDWANMKMVIIGDLTCTGHPCGYNQVCMAFLYLYLSNMSAIIYSMHTNTVLLPMISSLKVSQWAKKLNWDKLDVNSWCQLTINHECFWNVNYWHQLDVAHWHFFYHTAYVSFNVT